MSLHPHADYPIPEDTVRIARAAFPRGNAVMHLRDEFGMVFTDHDFVHLFPPSGQPAESPSRLLLITIFQFLEGLTDRQAADAVRSRLDWKYALSLDLTDPGFDFSILSEFRTRLLQHAAAQAYLDQLLDMCRDRGWLKARGRQRTDSTHILAAVRNVNRLECVGETMRAALNSVATVAPSWLARWAPPSWYDQYATRCTDFRLPKSATARQALAEQIGADGCTLVRAIHAPTAPPWLKELPAVVALQRIWWQHYDATHVSVRWRKDADLPPGALLIQSPYDLDARYSIKRDTQWLGYKVQITETCEEDTPHLITHVATTPAPEHDSQAVDQIHTDLADRDLLPTQHLVDAGYVTADTLVTSRQNYGVDLYGPIQIDHSWQAKAGAGFDAARFRVDWDRQTVYCPQGQASAIWKPTWHAHSGHVIHVAFHRTVCAACPVRPQCTRSATAGRSLTVRHRAHHEAVLMARERQSSPAFRKHYARRAGIEGTIAQGTRSCDLRHAWYRGQAKTQVQHVLTAIAMNLIRMVAWLQAIPHMQVHPSRFARLAPVPG